MNAKRIKKLAGIHKELADSVTGYNRLECTRCGASQPLTREQSARYFATGWPCCCDETMKLVRGTPA